MQPTDDQHLREADQFVEELRRSIHHGLNDVSVAKELLRTVLRRRMWADRIVNMTDRRQTYREFLRFVTDAAPTGLGTTITTLEILSKGDIELEDLLTREINRGQGGDQRNVDNINVDNINVDRPNGTSREYALRKLHAAAPELHERVIAGELSPHAAMLEAGFRRKTVSIPVDDVRAIARALVRHLTIDQIEELTSILAGND